jgi:hypothetical protein
VRFCGEERGEGVFIEGLGFRRWRRGSDSGGGCHDRAGLWREEEADKWVPPVSGSASAGAYPFGCGRLAGLGRLSGLCQLACPRPFIIFLFFSFSFLVFLFVSKHFQNIFKTLQTKHGVF